MSASISLPPSLLACPSSVGRGRTCCPRGRANNRARICVKPTCARAGRGREGSARRSTSPAAVRRPTVVPGSSSEPSRTVSAKASVAASAAVLLPPPRSRSPVCREPNPSPQINYPRKASAPASAAASGYLALAQRRSPAANVGGRRVRSPSKGRSGSRDLPQPRVERVQGPAPKIQLQSEAPRFWGVTSVTYLNNIEPINERIRSSAQPVHNSDNFMDKRHWESIAEDQHQIERELLERSWSAREATGSGANSRATARRPSHVKPYKVSRSRMGGRVVRRSNVPRIKPDRAQVASKAKIPKTDLSIPDNLIAAQTQLQALKKKCSPHIANASSANVDIVTELLHSSSSKVLLSRSEEAFLMGLIQRQKDIQAIEADLSSSGRDLSDEAVAEAAGLEGGVHELLLLRALAIEARELM
eukprot:scaffold76658_cov39-Prasinocladus_malaysianus.AAC.1